MVIGILLSFSGFHTFKALSLAWHFLFTNFIQKPNSFLNVSSCSLLFSYYCGSRRTAMQLTE